MTLSRGNLVWINLDGYVIGDAHTSQTVVNYGTVTGAVVESVAGKAEQYRIALTRPIDGLQEVIVGHDRLKRRKID